MSDREKSRFANYIISLRRVMILGYQNVTRVNYTRDKRLTLPRYNTLDKIIIIILSPYVGYTRDPNSGGGRCGHVCVCVCPVANACASSRASMMKRVRLEILHDVPIRNSYDVLLFTKSYLYV